MGIITKKLYFDLLENKERVKKDLQYEIHDDSVEKEELLIDNFDDILMDPVESNVQLQESLLNDLLESENELNKKVTKETQVEKPEIPVEIPIEIPIEKPVVQKLVQKPVVQKLIQKPLETKPRVKRTEKVESIKIPKPDNSTEHLEILAKKQELLIKFDILRKNTERYIPQYTMNHNYSIMKNHYKLLVKQLHLDGKVTTYKQMLLGASGYLEIFLGNFVGLDMEGFTKHQADNIHVYDKILTKLGEKSYTPTKFIESFPLEFQLLLTVGFQTLLFILTKTLPIAQIFQTNPMNS